MCVGATAVLSFFAKTLDCKVKKRILIALPGLNQDAKLLAQRYHIPYVEGESMENAARDLQLLLMQQKQPTAGQVKIGKAYDANLDKKVSGRRGTLDIMTDILRIVDVPSSSAEIMACANMSYEQCQKYLPAMEKMGLISRSVEDGIHIRYTITEKGREYLANMSNYGRIAEGAKSVWSTRRISKAVQVNSDISLP